MLAQMGKGTLSANLLERAWRIWLGADTIALLHKLVASLLPAQQCTKCVACS